MKLTSVTFRYIGKHKNGSDILSQKQEKNVMDKLNFMFSDMCDKMNTVGHILVHVNEDGTTNTPVAIGYPEHIQNEATKRLLGYSTE